MATVAETKHKAGRLLACVRAGQSLRPEDDTLLQEAYLQVYGDLKTSGDATWASTAELPNEVMPHVAAWMAFLLIPDKGIAGERKALILDLYGIAKPEIKRLVTPAHETVEEPTDY